MPNIDKEKVKKIGMTIAIIFAVIGVFYSPGRLIFHDIPMLVRGYEEVAIEWGEDDDFMGIQHEGHETQIEGETVIEYDFFTDVAIYDLTTLTPESFDFAAERQFTFQGAYRTAKIFDNKLYFVSHLLEWDNTKTPYYIEDSQNYEISNNYTLSSEGNAMFSLISLDKKENTKSMPLRLKDTKDIQST